MKNLLLLFTLSLFVWSSCEMKKSHSGFYVANNALAQAVAGHWSGKLPCASCPGIAYYLELNDDGQFREESVYLGEAENLFVTEGNWKVLEDSLLILESNGDVHKQFRYSPGSLIMQDMSGHEIRSTFAENYELKRETGGTKPGIDARNLDGKWALFEMDGAPVEMPGDKKGIPSLEFNPAESRVNGFGGCNHIGGPFEIEGDSLVFGAFIATKMACTNTPLENAFLKAISSQTFGFQIADSTLHLSNEENRLLLKKAE